MGSGPEAASSVDPSVPRGARVYDYLLGGKDHYAVDREAAERMLAVAPDARLLAREQRKFLVRAVRLIAEAGVRQFVDLGTGIPTSPNVHEIAQSVHPSARVVYVDFDPVVTAHNRALMATQPAVVAIEADIRDPDRILGDPAVQALIDWGEPVAVLLLAVLHNVSDDEDPAGIIARFRDRMAPGSYIAISQFDADSAPEARAQLEEIYAATPWPRHFRTRGQIEAFFDGFELLPPGVVDMEQWRPEMQGPPPTAIKIPGGVGRLRPPPNRRGE